MQAYITCVGCYHVGLIRHMDLPSHFYDKIEGNPIMIFDIWACATASQSRELAEALGIDPWDVNNHRLIPERFNWPKLKELAGEWEIREDLEALIFMSNPENGIYICVFRPNN